MVKQRGIGLNWIWVCQIPIPYSNACCGKGEGGEETKGRRETILYFHLPLPSLCPVSGKTRGPSPICMPKAFSGISSDCTPVGPSTRTTIPAVYAPCSRFVLSFFRVQIPNSMSRSPGLHFCFCCLQPRRTRARRQGRRGRTAQEELWRDEGA